MAILHAEGYAYLGGKGDMKVWNPHVESDDEYSTSRVALKIGSQANYEGIESGWAVSYYVTTIVHRITQRNRDKKLIISFL